MLVDADAASVLDYVEHGLRIARRGGIVLVAHALWQGRVADPAQRDETVADYRALLRDDRRVDCRHGVAHPRATDCCSW